MLLYSIRQPIDGSTRFLVLYNVAEDQLYYLDKNQCDPLPVAIRFVDRCEWPERIDNKWHLDLEEDHHIRRNSQFQRDRGLFEKYVEFFHKFNNTIDIKNIPKHRSNCPPAAAPA